MIEDLLKVIPEHWRSTALTLAILSPYLTRAFHALYHGNGIRGAVRGIWFGTNTPKEKETKP